ncbi:hypothetical protein Tco_0213496, partial [Tanacetum coccineum]
VKLHDVPIQVFEEDDISLIATFIGKPVMLDSYTSSMCNDSWGRSSFARCLIEVNSEANLVDVVTIGIPSLSEDDFTKETVGSLSTLHNIYITQIEQEKRNRVSCLERERGEREMREKMRKDILESEQLTFSKEEKVYIPRRVEGTREIFN